MDLQRELRRNSMNTKKQIAAMMYDPLLTQRQAAAYLGVCFETIQNYRRRGWISYSRLGWRTVRIRRSELDRFIDSRKKIGVDAGKLTPGREQCQGSASAAAAASSSTAKAQPTSRSASSAPIA
jgi:excisionase family DNA binding protein